MKAAWIAVLTVATLELHGQGPDLLDTGRYVTKPKKTTNTKPASKRAPAATTPEVDESTQKLEPSAGSLVPTPPLSAFPDQKNEPQSVVDKFSSETAPDLEDDNKEGGLGTALRDSLLGGSLEEVHQFRNALDPDDVRRNIFDLQIAASYFYNASQSPHSRRNYITQSPGGLIGLNLWLTPFIGLVTDYRFSQLNQIRDSQTTDNYISTNHNWYSIGVEFRRFFGISSNSPALNIAVKYTDYTFTAPGAVTTYSKLNTTGPEIKIKVLVPATKNLFWNLGFIVQPLNRHEESTTAGTPRSGQNSQSNAYGAFAGGEYRMSRGMRAFSELSILSYKHQFAGVTESADPVTGQTGNNIGVTNTFIFLDLGLRLGK